MKIVVGKTSIEIVADELGFSSQRFADVAELTVSIWKGMFLRGTDGEENRDEDPETGRTEEKQSDVDTRNTARVG